jgi:outer membrane protein assembly factor BamB
MPSFRWLLAGSLFLSSACTRGLEGAPCPCAAGYECCVVRNACYRLGESCASDGAGGTGQVSSDGSSAAPAAGAGMLAGSAGLSAGSAGMLAGSAGMLAGSAGLSAGSAGLSAGGEGDQGDQGDQGGEGGSIEWGGGPGDLGVVNEPAFVLVPTQHNDNARTGANLDESALTVASVVHPGFFGELSRRPLRGAVFAQPLVAPGVKLPAGGKLDLVYVATMGNVVYALDARKPELPPIWSRTLGSSLVLPDPLISAGSGEIWHEIGILGTPVLSVTEGALYAVAATKEGEVYAHHVHKLDLSTGSVLATAAIEQVDFVNAKHAQRSALTLAKGVLYVPFGDYNPGSDASGWVFTFDVNLSPLGIIRLGNPSGSGVTMSGQGPAADDSGSIFLATGPGFLTENEVSSAFASRVVALPEATGAGMSELFSCSYGGQCPSSEFGSSGPLLLPNSDQLVVAGQRDLYLLSRGAGAGQGPALSLLQKFRGDGSLACDPSAVNCAAMPSSPIYWPGSGLQPKPRLFAWASSDRLRAFEYDTANAHFACPNPANTGACDILASDKAISGASGAQILRRAAHLSVSSDGSERGSGIVWAAQPYTTDSLRSPDGILRAFDAENLAFIWNTETAGAPLGPLAPGATPTVSGGRVFVGTADGISRKWTFLETPTAATPAIANFADKSLVLAWAVSDPPNSGFKLTAASDGFGFGEVSSVYDTLFAPLAFASEPALATDGGHVYLGWTAEVTGLPPKRTVKIGVSADPSFDHYDFMTLQGASGMPEPLSTVAVSAPALAYGNHRLFLAYHEERVIVVLSSQDGLTFDPSTRVSIPLDYPSYRAPALAYLNGKLYVTSTDLFQHVKLFVSADDGANFTGPTLLPLLSEGHPALLMLNPQGTNEPDLHLLWSDTTNSADSSRIKIASVVAGDFSRLARSHEFLADRAGYSISATLFKDAWYVAWMGVGNTNYPNVARYSPGELVTYGLRAAR